jgi:hypothetical protein
MQTIRSRLLGYRENVKEVKKWGLAPVQPRLYTFDEQRFPNRTVLKTEKPLNWDNYD